MNNKKLGRDVMAFAEKHKALAPEQFGSRKNHQSVLAALNKRLTMDLLQQRRQAAGLYVPMTPNLATTGLFITWQFSPFDGREWLQLLFIVCLRPFNAPLIMLVRRSEYLQSPMEALTAKKLYKV